MACQKSCLEVPCLHIWVSPCLSGGCPWTCSTEQSPGVWCSLQSQPHGSWPQSLGAWPSYEAWPSLNPSGLWLEMGGNREKEEACWLAPVWESRLVCVHCVWGSCVAKVPFGNFISCPTAFHIPSELGVFSPSTLACSGCLILQGNYPWEHKVGALIKLWLCPGISSFAGAPSVWVLCEPLKVSSVTKKLHCSPNNWGDINVSESVLEFCTSGLMRSPEELWEREETSY